MTGPLLAPPATSTAPRPDRAARRAAPPADVAPSERTKLGEVAALRAWLWPRLDRYDLISFDVFDTLLARRIDPPEWVQQQICRALAARLETQRDLYPLRRAAEAEVRRRAAAQGNDAECTLEEVLRGSIDRCLAELRPADDNAHAVDAAALAEEFTAREIELEGRVAFPVPGMTALLDDLRAAGRRVVLVSDMYLSPATIRRLLAANGFAGDDLPLYVSSQWRVAKASGRLFDLVLQHEAVTAGRALHVGDHPHSDFAVPLRNGWSAVLWCDRDAQRRRYRAAQTLACTNGRRADYWRGLSVVEFCTPRRNAPPAPAALESKATDAAMAKAADAPANASVADELARVDAAAGGSAASVSMSDEAAFLYEYGRDVLALPYCVFLHHVVERVAAREIEQLLFVAREGHLFQQIYARLAAALPGAAHRPAMSYACLSRQSTDLGDAARGAVDPTARSLLADYLGQCGFWGRQRRVALVDIGWRGSIERHLRTLFATRDDFPSLTGLYLGRRRGERDDENDSIVQGEGLLFDSFADERGAAGRRADESAMRRTSRLGTRAVLECMPLLEEAARAPHGTTCGYRRAADGGVEPVFAADEESQRRAERVAEASLAVVQQGVLDFAAEYANAVDLFGDSAATMMPYLAVHLTRMLCLPRRSEARALLPLFCHAADAAAPAQSLGEAGFRWWRGGDWRRLLARGAGPQWRQATLAQMHRAAAWLFSLANYARRIDP